MNFDVSVVIPVYNAERFIERAIDSVLMQSEVKEVIVINDGSTDSSVNIIRNHQKLDSRIILLHHDNRQNKGRSESRNLGIKKATSNFIAFLDADDFYLENRFKNDSLLFGQKKEIDGIYNAVDFFFYRQVTPLEKKTLTINTMSENLDPDFLFEALITGGYGHFHINGLTLKKEVFKTIGLFNVSLKVAEDTDVFWKLALKCQLVAGILDKPVAKRGVHEENIFNNEETYKKYRIKMYQSLAIWSANNNIKLYKIDLLLKWVWNLKSREKNSLFKDIIYWFGLVIKAPRLFFSILGIKYFPLVRYRQKLLPFIFK